MIWDVKSMKVKFNAFWHKSKNMTINYKQAKVILRGMICLNEYEAESIDIAIKAINACINNKYEIK